MLAKLRTIRASLRLRTPARRTLLAVGLTALAGSAPAQTITTVAGGGPSSGTATQRPLGFPYQIALDAAGNRYVATGPLHMVVKIDTTGVLTVIAGTGADDATGDFGPATSASLKNPNGVAVDPLGNVYISDYFAHTIRRVAAGTGTITTIAGLGFAGGLTSGVPAASAALNHPGHLYFAAGYLYIADTQNHAIRRIDVSGTGNITTVAGTGSAGFGDGAAASALFNAPNGVAVDTTGNNVYVADTLNHRVRRILAGNVTTIAGTGTPGAFGDGGPATSAQLNSPEGVFVDAAGIVYIACEYNFAIRRITSGTITRVAGGTSGFGGDGGPALSAAMQRPWTVVVDSAGNIIVGDTFNSRLRRIDAGTGFINTIGGSGATLYGGDPGPAISATLNNPYGVALDGSGNLYFADESNGRVRRVDAGTGVISLVAGTGVLNYNGDGIPATTAMLAQPRGVAVDASGNVYIADTLNNRIRRVDAGTGMITTVAGNGSGGFLDGVLATSAMINQPNGVAVDASGNLYIADTINHRVRKVDAATGLISTLAGNSTSGSTGDGGPATSALLNNPRSLTLDASGNIFIADTGNHRVRRIDRVTGIITRVAGGGFGFAGDGGPATSALMRFPVAVAVDTRGNLFIADTDNFRVRLVEARTGRITTVAGNGSAGFLGDGGPATAAKLNKPQAVAVNGTGRVFFSDVFNQRIRAMIVGADLSITKDDFQTSEIPGTSVSYTVRVTNNGPNTLTSVNVVDTVPPTLLGVSYAPASGTYVPGTGDWTGLSLGTGQSVTMVVSGTIASSATGSITNTVVVAPPLGLTDPIASNNQATDVDALNPEADVSIAKSAAPDPATLGLPLVYTLNVGNPLGPSDATDVIVTDTMPAGVTLVSATPPCTITGTTVTCALGTIPAGSFHPPLSITVIPDQPGTIVNTATVSHGETDSATSNDTATATTVVKLGGGDTVRHLTVTSKDGENIVQWLNPMAFGIVRLRYRTDPTSCTFPTDPDGSDGSFGLPDVPGTPNEPGRYEHYGLVNGNYYCYTAWVNTGAPWSARRTIKGRPFQVLPGPGAKWGFNMGIFSMVPPGNGVGVVYSVANDGSLHAMVKGSGVQGGTWPGPLASLPVWKPQSMNGPSQGRPSGIPVPTSSSTRTIFLSSQDGHVYAFNAETGAPAWSPSSPLLAPSANLQAHPSGVFTTFGGTRDLIFVGTRDPAGSRFYALRLLDGNKVAPGWEFDGGAIGKIGAINGQAAVDQAAKRVYFGSREFDPVDNKTVWCLDLETGVPCAGFPPRAHGNVDGGVSLSGTRLFVGTNYGVATDPRVRALRASDGLEDWSFPILPAGEGAPKGYVTVDRLTGDVYFSTATTVWAVNAGGGLKWSNPSLTAPSIPLFAPGDLFVYVGAGDGKLHRLRVTAGIEDMVAPFPIRLGDGSAGVGSPTYDLPAAYVYVGSEDGIVYAIQLP